MPVRLVCPSCSATLSVKDEYAGRAVKCPKCGDVIPAAQPAAPPPALPPPLTATPSKAAVPALPTPSKASPALPPPAPEPERPLFEAVDEPAKTRIKGRPTGKPVAKADGDFDDDAKPAKRKDRDDDRDEPVAKRGSKKGDDRDDDRPARTRRKRDADDEDGDRPGKKKGGSKVAIILGVVGLLLLTCCGPLGYGGWWAYNREQEREEERKAEAARGGGTNAAVNKTKYESLKVGTTTRTEAEASLGKGKLATTDDIEKVFLGDADQMDRWMSMVIRSRAVVWQNGDDRLLAAFHPNGDADGRLQVKVWRPKTGANARDGESDDGKFVAAYPLKKESDPKKDSDPNAPKPLKPQAADKTGAAVTVTAATLIGDYEDNPGLADTRYKGKRLLVSGGVVETWENDFTAQVVAKDQDGQTRIRVRFLDDQQAQIAKVKVGDAIKFRGTLSQRSGPVIAIERGWIVP